MKTFLIGQRVIYANCEIVTCVRPGRDYRISAPNANGQQWVRRVDDVDIYVDVINLKALPGGQL